LAELLRRVFRYYGFEGELHGDGEALLLRKGSLAIEVVPVPGAGETGGPELASILSRETKADRRIVVSLGNFSPAARALAEDRRVMLWDRRRLEEEAGRMLLAEVDTRQAAADGLLEPFLQCEMEALGAEAAPEGVREPATPDGPLPALELFDGEGMLSPAVTQEQARSLVSEKLEGAFRLDLRMVPHYCYAYACPVRRGAGQPEVRRGLLLVNGIGGEVSGWEPAPLARWDGAADRMEPSLEQSLALEKALRWIIADNTRIVHLKHDRGSVTVYEKVTLKPTPEAPRLEYRGLVLWPVWGIEGGNGAVVLDAVDGKVLKEELFAPAARSNPATRDNCRVR
jgi:hypothetical protein